MSIAPPSVAHASLPVASCPPPAVVAPSGAPAPREPRTRPRPLAVVGRTWRRLRSRPSQGRSLWRWFMLLLVVATVPLAAVSVASLMAQRAVSTRNSAEAAYLSKMMVNIGEAQNALLQLEAFDREHVRTGQTPEWSSALARSALAFNTLLRDLPASPMKDQVQAQWEELQRLDISDQGFYTALQNAEMKVSELNVQMVGVDARQVDEARDDLDQQMFIVVGALLLSMLFALGAARMLVSTVRRPLLHLQQRTRRFAEGDFEIGEPLNSYSVFNELDSYMTAMADQIGGAQALLQHQASHDGLTCLANRVHLTEQTSAALAGTRAGSRGGEAVGEVAVLFVDLDNFKQINDLLGHHIGDLFLESVANRIKDQVRGDDTVARLGGDEFAILLQAPDARRIADSVASRVLRALAHPVTVGGRTLVTSGSIGIAVATEGMQAADLLRAADLAMYEAKRAGKGRSKHFEPNMFTDALEHMELETDFREAVTAEEITLSYQPIVDLSTGETRSVEALARWTHAERGPVRPDVFIELAERTGLIHELGLHLLTTACRELPALQRHFGTQLTVTVNVTVSQLLRETFVGNVAHVLSLTGVNPAHVGLELTESGIAQDLDLTRERLQDLKKLGVKLLMDDFGTGYSSLSYLRHLPFDTLKIDRAFIDDVATVSSHDHTLVRAILSLSRPFGMTVVAEGIERSEQGDELRRLGCDLGQGFMWSKPQSLAEWQRTPMPVPRSVDQMRLAAEPQIVADLQRATR